MAGTAACARIARTRLAALVVGLGVLEIAVSGVAVAGRKRAGAIPDLDQVAEPIGRMVAGGFVAVVTVPGGHRIEAHGELPAAGDGERPGSRGEGPLGACVTAGVGVACVARASGQGGGGDGEVQAGREPAERGDRVGALPRWLPLASGTTVGD